MRMKNLKIGTRLGIGFAVVLVLLAALTAIAVIRMQAAKEITDHLVNTSYKNQRLVAEWAKLLELNALRAKAAWLVVDPAHQKSFEAQIASSSVRSAEV
jgi:methyl-accepting chemotaxis protein